jgi:glycosyltransferase involved in cell wall biosynthesis
VPRFCFLTERQVGIGSAAGAIEPFVRRDPNVEWTDVTYSKPGGMLERLPLPGRMGGTLRGVQQATKALLRGPFDALFFLTHNPAVFQPWALAKTPSLLWTDVTPALLDQQAEQYDHPVDRFRAVSQVKHALVKRTFQAAALCVGWSEWARASFVADYDVPPERTAVVSPGIDLSRWVSAQGRVDDSLPRLLFVGGNFERKGGNLLLDVFRHALRGRCELDLVTRDPVPEEPGVRVHRGMNAGSEPLMALYRSAAAFVLPTRGDCFSIASIEAMAMGLPVVVSDVGGIAEIVDDDTGFLIAPGDGLALSGAIDALLADSQRRRDLGVNGRRKAEQRFSARETAARLLALMTQIAGQRARS